MRNLVKTFSGLLRPDAGEIHFRGERVDGLRRHGVSQRGIMRTFQIPRELERRGKGQTGEPLGAALFTRLRLMFVGVLLIVFMMFRPEGLWKEEKQSPA